MLEAPVRYNQGKDYISLVITIVRQQFISSCPPLSLEKLGGLCSSPHPIPYRTVSVTPSTAIVTCW